MGFCSKITCSSNIGWGFSVIIMVNLELIWPIFPIRLVTMNLSFSMSVCLYVGDYVVDSPEVMRFFHAFNFLQRLQILGFLLRFQYLRGRKLLAFFF